MSASSSQSSSSSISKEAINPKTELKSSQGKSSSMAAPDSTSAAGNKKVVESHFSFSNQYSDIKDMYDKAEVVVIGNVISSTPDPIGKAAFTNFELNEIKVLKNAINCDEKNIVPSMTGGEIDGVLHQSKEIKLISVGETYMFFLTRRYSPDRYPKSDKSNLFTPMGAYQGIFKLESSTKAFAASNNAASDILTGYNIAEFNDKNKLEQNVKGKSLSEIAEIK